MSTFEQILNTGIPVIFPGGEQFHLLEADEPVDVTFYDNRNRPIEKWEAMKGGFRHIIKEGFIQVGLESATGQTVKIALTSGRGEYDRSQGDINVLNIVKDNSWYYDSLQKKAFIGGYGLTGGIDRNMIQLWNPSASGKLLVCDAISISNTNAGVKTFLLHHHNAALPSAGSQGNKYLAEAAGAGLIKHAHLAALGTEYCRYGLAEGEESQIPLKKPFIIGQGLGLIVLPLLDSDSLAVRFEWAEIDA